MTPDQLVARYERGAIIAEELFVRLLLVVDPAAPGLVLDSLPADLRTAFGTFVREYRVGQMVCSRSGPLPVTEQVVAAREWLTRTITPSHEFPMSPAAGTPVG